MKHLAMKQVPRYTSYPTAPHFGVLTSAVYKTFLAKQDVNKSISLYVHIPFCEQLCWYCGCNTRITSKYSPIAEYVKSVMTEIEHVVDALPAKMDVSHIAWGGGTPTKLESGDFKKLSDFIHTKFNVLPDAEIAVEIDPRTLKDDMVQMLGECGVNRVSFGVQDFDLGVQEAINRIQPYEMTRDVVEKLRAVGVKSVNFDLIYGLPLQTKETIVDTVDKTKSILPDRIALFGYAHVPWMKKHQLMLEKHHLPTTDERLVLVKTATDALVKAGYVRVGLDHFALPHDEMAIKWQQGSLGRNFQGYTTDEAETLIGFGASAIGKMPECYVQNHTSVKDYNDAIREVGFACHKGVALSEDDRIRADVITSLMCALSVDLNEVAVNHGVEVEYFDSSLSKVAEYVADGIVRVEGVVVSIPAEHQAYVRLIAACFDSYLETGKAKHSMAV